MLLCCVLLCCVLCAVCCMLCAVWYCMLIPVFLLLLFPSYFLRYGNATSGVYVDRLQVSNNLLLTPLNNLFTPLNNLLTRVYCVRRPALQTHAVMPLATGVVPSNVVPRTLANLEHQIKEVDGGHLDTGLTGTYFMTKMLMEAGRNDLIFTWANKTDYPSYGYVDESFHFISYSYSYSVMWREICTLRNDKFHTET